ncbi:acyltransferase family protein [Brevundimonas goettingensis]|uniref:Acyltransferase n=1 Tax=Brevundimonas goettingensis TaxID=2774190 RepID=A0A975BYJ9_9CAUL|nr:acyltransferase [Brevundimonas goettingensis]QTC90123.1 acyltransferase [Brevundimonas goettingensis]
MAWTAISTRNETPPISRGGWLDALRFIVASLIILHHFQAAGPVPLSQLINPIFERGGFLLTNFFLIDSGYVLMRVYGAAVNGGKMSPGDFFLKRYLRVVPAHLIMGLALVTLVVVSTALGEPPRNPEWFRWDQLPAQLTLTQAFGVHGGLGWNAPSWSVSALIGCYLAFPWILKGMKRLGPWTALAGVVLLYLGANQAAWALFGYPVYQMPMMYGFWRALPLFILGMGLAQFTERVWIAPKLAAVVGVVSAAAFFVLELFDKHALVALVLISLIILAAGAVPVTRPSKLVEKLSVMSFSMFITNEVTRIAWFGLANVLITRLALPVAVQWVLYVCGVAAAFAVAFAFHSVIDQPLQTRIKGWLKRRRTGRAAVVPEPAQALRTP